VILAALESPNTIRSEFEVLSGDTPIEAAVRAVSGRPVEH
jgi:hypothetical protein